MTLSICNRPSRIVLRLGFFFVLLSFGLSTDHAQELVKTSTETNVGERVRLLETELERQNAKRVELQKTLLVQQSTIKALLDKLSVHPSNTATATAVKEPATTASATVAVTPE